jgi:hypothetical protein
LLTFGDADWDDWDDYAAYGFTGEHVPELIRLGTDRHLLVDDDVDDAAMWAPMHAWRVLAQMNSPEAIAPLVHVLALVDEADSDLINEGLQDVLESFGPAAIDPLAAFLVEAEDGNGGLVGAGEALSRIGTAHPEHRDQITQILSAAFEARYATNDPMINGFWIADLLDLNAVESYPAIKKAFEENKVDPSIAGDLEDVEIEFGLLKERKTPRPLTPLQRAFKLALEREFNGVEPFPLGVSQKVTKKEKAKRKQEKKSRKKNRKKR